MAAPFFLEYFDPPEELKRHILVLFHYSCDAPEIADRHPGGMGQLVLFPTGAGEIEAGGQTHSADGDAFMLSGFSVAAPFLMRGPWSSIGVTLSPLGWAALTNVPACDHIDRFFPPEELLGPDITEFALDLNHRYRTGEVSGKEACDELGGWIAQRLSPVQPAHEALIQQTLDWLGKSLNPPLEDLFENTSYSRRQTERLVERYFGAPPAALVRKYRAIRAAALLAQPQLSDRTQATIAAAFHDRPHMVHEIRRYCAHTPTRIGGNEDPILVTLLQMKNFQRLKLFNNIK